MDQWRGNPEYLTARLRSAFLGLGFLYAAGYILLFKDCLRGNALPGAAGYGAVVLSFLAFAIRFGKREGVIWMSSRAFDLPRLFMPPKTIDSADVKSVEPLSRGGSTIGVIIGRFSAGSLVVERDQFLTPEDFVVDNGSPVVSDSGLVLFAWFTSPPLPEFARAGDRRARNSRHCWNISVRPRARRFRSYWFNRQRGFFVL